MRLDHLLSKEKRRSRGDMCFTVEVLREEEVLAHRGAKNSFRTKFGAERLTKYSMPTSSIP